MAHANEGERIRAEADFVAWSDWIEVEAASRIEERRERTKKQRDDLKFLSSARISVGATEFGHRFTTTWRNEEVRAASFS